MTGPDPFNPELMRFSMKLPILASVSAIALFSILLYSCNSSSPTDENAGGDGAPDLTGLDDFKGIANGTVKIGEKTFPIEFISSAYSKRFSLTGFTDLAKQDTGWKVFLAASAATTSPQDIKDGLNQAVLGYQVSWDSTQCGYKEKSGTLTVESFVAKKSGTKNYFTTSGKANFTATKSTIINYSAVTCPDINVEVTFTKVNVYDAGLNL
jgi:hypothetical protein